MAINSINTLDQVSDVSGTNGSLPLNQLGTQVPALIEIPVGTQNNAQQPIQVPLTATTLVTHNLDDGSGLSDYTPEDLGPELSTQNNPQQPTQLPLTAANLLAHNLENGSNLDDDVPSDQASEHIYVDPALLMIGNQDVTAYDMNSNNRAQ